MADTVALAELCDEIVDCPHSTPVWMNAGVVVLRSQNIRGGRLDLSSPSYTDENHFKQRTKRATPRGGDLVITREAPMGEVCILPEGLKCCLGQRMVLLRPDPKKADPRYLLYALQSQEVQREIGANEGTGSTVSNLRIPLLEALRIPWRPLPEQRRIAHILGTLDDKIDLNRRMNETLEQMARALFKSWFVDFDPVRAKAEGRDPGLPSHLADLFPSRLVDSPLGPIPEDWDVRPLSDVATNHRDGVDPMDKPDDAFEHFSIPAFDDGQTPRLERGVTIRSRKYVIGDDSVLVSKLNPEIPRVWWANASEGGRSVASTEFLVLRPKPGYGRAFVYCVASSAGFHEQISGLVTGTSKSHQRAGRDSVLGLLVVVAPRVVSSAFESLALQWLERTVEARVETSQLAASRDALLPHLLQGVCSRGDQ